MLRSMYSAISGMRNMQTKLDVIGNNIANVNTFGFKKGRTTFKDMVSQQLAGATGPGGGRGGVNPRQVGLGVQLASIDTIHTQGSLQNTNRELDLGISGDGYFVVGTEPASLQNMYYTRAGNFYLDQQGYIVNADGLYLLGAMKASNSTVDNPSFETGLKRIQIPSNAESFSIGADGIVYYINENGLQIAGRIALAKFSNPEGLQKVGSNLYQQTANSGQINNPTIVNNPNNVNAFISFPNNDAAGTGEIVAGTLEMSNVDLAEEFTEMIVAQRGFQANTRVITTSDEILQELVNLKR